MVKICISASHVGGSSMAVIALKCLAIEVTCGGPGNLPRADPCNARSCKVTRSWVVFNKC